MNAPFDQANNVPGEAGIDSFIHYERLYTRFAGCFVATAMMLYGGSFVRHLGQALIHADPRNTRLIAVAWSDYWERYREMVSEERWMQDIEAFEKAQAAARRRMKEG